MQRRTVLQAMAAGASVMAITGVQSATTAVDQLKRNLPKAPRQPVLFLGHGSPMNVIEDNNAYRASWNKLGADFGSHTGAKWPKPTAIVMISAHWLSRGTWVTSTEKPKTIHDFGGFPQKLFDQQYPAPGSPALAAEVAQLLKPEPVLPDNGQWGLDHGAWSVLLPMFPKADIPVLQLSVDYNRPPAELMALAKALRPLRDRGVLIVGSGNIVHNLMASRNRNQPTYDWGLEFDAKVTNWLDQGDFAAAANFLSLGALAKSAHPTHDHYLPLLYALASVDATKEAPKYFNADFQGPSISMRSMIWG